MSEKSRITFASVNQAKLPFNLVLQGNEGTPAGTIKIDKELVTFEGNFDESAQVFIEHLARRWSQQWSEHVAEMVLALTNIARPEDGNRIQRFIINVRELEQSLDMQTRMIKLADLLDNTSSIVSRDPEFSAIYLAEKDLMLDVLFDGKEIGADAGVVEYLEKKGIEHSLLINARAMVKKGIASLQPVHTKRYEKHKALIWGAWEAA
ncbi:guanosine polyphosphate pyrophosphohydrolase [Enterobacter hormaechei]|uniref:guanosine polyphosphate pyrophosphohydrolase n=1 Tax=Enterobacter hormaechei TaxID=158836 RepID=UPI002DC03D89|nr:guanosine polyphosphate pyrophosphohydrolase [Enterobacter hormaechei]MEB8029153.1 guanosine polyphosphate pyrophosphohydrolase [Enterobacter hormaechei]